MKALKVIAEIAKEGLRNVCSFAKDNLKNSARVINFISPYVMFIVGQFSYKRRGYIFGSVELIIPVAFAISVYFINSYANKIGKGISVPVPNKRFTSVDEDGEVSIRNDRIQELLLYVADLEDWLEKKDLL